MGTVSKFRLRSSAFERPDDNDKIDPKKMIFLSVEGDETERTYFQHLNEHLNTALIQIEVLRHRRGDGYSDPEYVLELLDEYINVRQGELIPDDLFQVFIEKYSEKTIKDYLEGNPHLPAKTKGSLREDLLKIGIDLEYRQYLQTFDKDTDYFAIVLDRDCGNHSRDLLQGCIEKCHEKGYGCFISNPCFEFWLLLHLCDVKSEFDSEWLEKLRLNTTLSNRHTQVSFEVSKRAHHGKTISACTFNKYYFPRIRQAIINANCFATDSYQLLDNIGSNLPQLFDELNFYPQ